MKVCVFITGTNSVGKTSLAFAIIEKFGGVDSITNDVTYCRNGAVSLAGKYGVCKFGGVDSITNDKGHSCTSRLPEVVEEALENSDTVFCEGSFMNTFGLNLTNALFKADKYLIVNLWCDPKVLVKRLAKRSNGKNKKGYRNWEKIFEKQKLSMISAKKFQSIGVPVLQINTAEHSIEDMLAMVLDKYQEIIK